MQDWVVRLRRRFLWSPFSVVVGLESERGRFEPVEVGGVVDMIGMLGRMEKGQTGPHGAYNLIPPLSGK